MCTMVLMVVDNVTRSPGNPISESDLKTRSALRFDSLVFSATSAGVPLLGTTETTSKAAAGRCSSACDTAVITPTLYAMKGADRAPIPLPSVGVMTTGQAA